MIKKDNFFEDIAKSSLENARVQSYNLLVFSNHFAEQQAVSSHPTSFSIAAMWI